MAVRCASLGLLHRTLGAHRGFDAHDSLSTPLLPSDVVTHLRRSVVVLGSNDQLQT